MTDKVVADLWDEVRGAIETGSEIRVDPRDLEYVLEEYERLRVDNLWLERQLTEYQND